MLKYELVSLDSPVSQVRKICTS